LPFPLHHRAPPSFPTRRSSDLSNYHHLGSLQADAFRGLGRIVIHFPTSSKERFKRFLRGLRTCGTALSFVPSKTIRYSGRGKERSEEHTSELQSRFDLVCRLLL